MLTKLKENRLVLVLGGLFGFLGIVHIPLHVFPHAFDKNASVEFITLNLIALLFGAFILLKPRRFLFEGKAVLAIWILFLAAVFSTLVSTDPIAALPVTETAATGGAIFTPPTMKLAFAVIAALKVSVVFVLNFGPYIPTRPV